MPEPLPSEYDQVLFEVHAELCWQALLARTKARLKGGAIAEAYAEEAARLRRLAEALRTRMVAGVPGAPGQVQMEAQAGQAEETAPPEIDQACPHGHLGDCAACDIESDLAYDAARERRYFGGRR